MWGWIYVREGWLGLDIYVQYNVQAQNAVKFALPNYLLLLRKLLKIMLLSQNVKINFFYQMESSETSYPSTKVSEIKS